MSIWTDKDGRLHVGIMVAGCRIHRRLPAGASKGDAKLVEAELRRAAGRRQPSIPGDPPMAETQRDMLAALGGPRWMREQIEKSARAAGHFTNG